MMHSSVYFRACEPLLSIIFGNACLKLCFPNNNFLLGFVTCSKPFVACHISYPQAPLRIHRMWAMHTAMRKQSLVQATLSVGSINWWPFTIAWAKRGGRWVPVQAEEYVEIFQRLLLEFRR